MDDFDDAAVRTELEDVTKKIDTIIKKVDTYEAEINKDTNTEHDHRPESG